MRKIILCLFLVFLCACGTSGRQQGVGAISISGNIILTDDNGNVDIDITNTEFLNKGFKYGDSVNIELENGYQLKDIPFLSGMYVEYGGEMVYGKASKDKVSLIRKYDSFVDNSGAAINMQYTIELNTVNKYEYIERIGCLEYTNNYEDYNDEIKFSNFREVTVGNIKEGRLFRSASVVDNSANRAAYTSKLALDNGIKTIINIIDDQDDFDELMINLNENSKTLINNSKIILSPISNNYQAGNNIKKIISGLNELIDNEYPYLIHCLEGKDRTGYELAIIEALCNATYKEIIDDYMLTYDNYYGINKNSDLEKYNYIKETNIDAMLRFITESEDIENVNYASSAKTFLIKYGMSEENIDALINKLCK